MPGVPCHFCHSYVDPETSVPWPQGEFWSLTSAYISLVESGGMCSFKTEPCPILSSSCLFSQLPNLASLESATFLPNNKSSKQEFFPKFLHLMAKAHFHFPNRPRNASSLERRSFSGMADHSQLRSVKGVGVVDTAVLFGYPTLSSKLFLCLGCFQILISCLIKAELND